MANTNIPVAAETWVNCGGAGGSLFQWTGANNVWVSAGVAGAGAYDGVEFDGTRTQPQRTISWGLATDMWVWCPNSISVRRLD